MALRNVPGSHSRSRDREAQALSGRDAQTARISRVPIAAASGNGLQGGAARWSVGTPPFMHNGSVPNLYEMLLPARQRSKTFYIGREFDPVKVGLDTTAGPGKFLYDTTQRGNSNAGHSFENGPRGNGVVGPSLTDTQRWALVEYLKSIPSEAGRVTPFGGPPNAVTGNAPWGKPPAQ